MRECFHGEYGILPVEGNVLGVLSLMIWALISIVSVKYLTFILRADNRGEGGVLALTAQLMDRTRGAGRLSVLVLIGLFATALLYGDGMITPAISVLSAVEGLGIAAPSLSIWVQPITIAILIGLFWLQKYGTRRVGILFGPITTAWMLVLAALGIASITKEPRILLVVDPRWAVGFLRANPGEGFTVLGAVFLVVTGTEALFADMGHFGRRPIRVAWYGLVLPSLLCNYLGQGAMLLRSPEAASNPFYALAPGWAIAPLIALATVATIIASQAVIAGAFSITHQAIQLGLLPRMHIVHTSPTERGQIHVPRVSRILMIATIGLVVGFRHSSELAAAYGVAVTGTMTISTILFCAVARRRWRWRWWQVALFAAVFLAIDLTFLAANASKITHGAWFPLVIAVSVFVVMTTWNEGRARLAERLYSDAPPLEELAEQAGAEGPIRVPGNAVFMAGTLETAPPALMHNLRSNKVLHDQVAVLHIFTEDIPRVDRRDKVEVDPLEHGFWRISAYYGYMERPNVPHILAMAHEQGLPFDTNDAIYFLGRERIVPNRRPVMARWRESLFSLLSLTALGATRYYHIPPEQVVELGPQVKM